MSTLAKSNAGASATGRLLSLDALRGFDMFWIIGGEELFKATARHIGGPVQQVVEEHLDHVEWEGFHFYDLIFPLFLFLVGVVLPFSLGKLRERGAPASTLYWRIARRTLLLFVLGLIYNNVPNHMNDLLAVRVAGVLQRIALCYGFAALVVMHTRVRGQVLLTAVLLLGYWAILAWVPVPGGVAGDYTKAGNLAGYLDRNYLPGKIYTDYYGFGDNEGLLSTLPAFATALLGVLAGHWLRTTRPGPQKVLGLVVAGLVCLGVGYVWGYRFPIVKNLWTSSFVLFAGGWSLLLLALFYGIIDVLGYRRWCFFFVVIGANAITVYLLAHFLLWALGEYLKVDPSQSVLWSLALLTGQWVFLLLLYRNRLFLRV
jgi:predicted acyltransferase